MKLALHRSITFWSGILVMTFICWAWCDSFHRSGYLLYEAVTIRNANDGVSVTYTHGRALPFHVTHDSGPRLHPEWRTLQAPFFLRGTHDDPVHGFKWSLDFLTQLDKAPGERKYHLLLLRTWPVTDWVAFLPHWLILLAIALPWLALLFLRSRRRAAASRPHSDPCANPSPP